MSSTRSMNARKCVHAQKPYPTQALAHESSKVGGRGKGKREGDGKDRSQEADGKKDSPTKQKHIVGTKTRPTYIDTAKVNKVGEGTLNFPLPQNVTPFPLVYLYGSQQWDSLRAYRRGASLRPTLPPIGTVVRLVPAAQTSGLERNYG